MTQPERRFKAGACTASIFVNEVQTADGTVQVKNVVLQRTYKAKDGSFQQTARFSANDIPKAQLALRQAFEYLMLDQSAG